MVTNNCLQVCIRSEDMTKGVLLFLSLICRIFFFSVVNADTDVENDFNDTNQVLAGVNMSKCECADILASVFPQLVMHWSAAGNKLKTFR